MVKRMSFLHLMNACKGTVRADKIEVVNTLRVRSGNTLCPLKSNPHCPRSLRRATEASLDVIETIMNGSCASGGGLQPRSHERRRNRRYCRRAHDAPVVDVVDVVKWILPV